MPTRPAASNQPSSRGRTWPLRALVLGSVGALLLGCSAGGNGDAAPESEDGQDRATFQVGMIGQQEHGEPVRGGTLAFGALAEPAVLDPARTLAAGSTGGLAMAAVYDVLMRYDPETKELTPRLAKSLEPDDGHTRWTLTLRDVEFSDGTPLDAAAVAWSIARYVEEGGSNARLWAENVAATRTPDDHTVVFSLREPWPDFGFMLAGGPGMIVARSSVQGGSFTPTGAGPFVFDHHAPGEEIVLTANPDYWDGAPQLERIEVSFLRSSAARLDSLQSGGLDATFFNDPAVITDALDGGAGGYLNLVSLGNVAVINASRGRPGSDPRVRRAMHQAIDPEVIYQRAHEGVDLASNAVFAGSSRWHGDVDPLPYDPEAARELLAQAKADGYDGKLTYTAGQAPTSRTTALTVEAMLEAVGFEVELNLLRSTADRIRQVAVTGDYDVAGWGISWTEAGLYTRMFTTMHSSGNFRVSMPSSEAMDALIEEFQASETVAEKRDVTARLQQEWNELVPALVYGPSPELVAWSDAVHGVTGTINSMVLLDDAWLDPSA